tara:strand:- start:31 stop:402 length:372 start_codon:yes stop_codon:yes gene_type:complete
MVSSAATEKGEEGERNFSDADIPVCMVTMEDGMELIKFASRIRIESSGSDEHEEVVFSAESCSSQQSSGFEDDDDEDNSEEEVDDVDEHLASHSSTVSFLVYRESAAEASANVPGITDVLLHV